MKRKILIYLCVITVFAICSSFDGRTRFEGNDVNWKIYFFPNTNDSATYLVQQYSSIHGAIPHKISEQLFVEKVLRSEITLRDYGGGPEVEEIIYYGKGNVEEVGLETWPKYRQLRLPGRNYARISYYKDFSIKELELRSDNIIGPRQKIEWDSLHQFSWSGIVKNHPIRDTIEQQELITAEIILQVRETDSYQKSGVWKRHDRLGRLVDSMRYK